MKRDATGPALSAIFVDYDNIYLSLKRKNEDAAKRFSKDAGLWLKELENGRLITMTSGVLQAAPRRIVMNRCYGNPVPRRNSNDNSTDMNSFPFVRHHFLRSGSEVIDCPPLTAQLKNSADIRIVMDVRDMIAHDTYFDEFVILSGDADFTPLLHRLRAHARRTIIYTNDHTASPYTAISDGEVRESTLLQLLLDGKTGASEPAIEVQSAPAQIAQAQPALAQPARPQADLSALRREIVAEVATLVRSAGQPVPLEALADRTLRQMGHDKTAGTGWGGAGGFRELLAAYLPEDLRISEQPPFVVFEMARALPPAARPERQAPAPQRLETLPQIHAQAPQPQPQPALHRLERLAPLAQRGQAAGAPAHDPVPLTASLPPVQRAPAAPPLQPAPAPQANIAHEAPKPVPQPVAAPNAAARPAGPSAIAIQQAVARIYDACQAPPLSPPEYRTLFDVMAQEISTRGLTGAPTLDNIAAAAKALGVDVRGDDVRFVLEVVSETDPWFEQGASANLFASRFRNFVVARCRSHGLTLGVDELDLIEHWFAGAAPASQPQPALAHQPQQAPQARMAPQAPAAPAPADRWWSMDTPAAATDAQGQPGPADEFPRIIRSRMRG